MTEAPPIDAIPDETAYAEAVQLAADAAAAYYGDGTSPLDDDAYDRLVRGIAAYEKAHPDQVLEASPTGKVAGVVGDVPHTVPMLSLDNVFGPEELAGWTASLERRLGRPVTAWSVEPRVVSVLSAAGDAVDTPADVLSWLRRGQQAVVLLMTQSERDWELLLEQLQGASMTHGLIAVIDEESAPLGVRAMRSGARSRRRSKDRP
ncbi:hypothetical protein [Microbispora sp. NBRC 16548]|uniref:hypothetical protein n=1 Tax=Microbispora sp. NBRC 16548 TaxID=3030994 RepID=UPI0024A5DD29|nr:hypothetical protein [Microbispora sp. NBRC 16548]GLX11594.1 hypothetical protein Misp03_85200 [Microbispora sp. NBRC 16548]